MSQNRRIRLQVERLEDRCVPAIYMVKNLNDSGVGSLRQAVLDANATSDADQVFFADGLSGTITLTGGEIPITSHLKINGPGASQLTISGNDASRIFLIDDGAFSSIKVVIQDLSLANGHAAAGGGAIWNREDLTLANTEVFGNNKFLGMNGAHGGAIQSSGNLTLAKSTFRQNGHNDPATALYGGAVFMSGPLLTVTGSSFFGNLAASGGALFTTNATAADVSNSTFLVNRGAFGGAVWCTGATTFVNCRFLGNGILTQGNGGAIYHADGNLTVASCTLSGNSAPTGGAIFSVDGNASIINSTIAHNSTFAEGGGIFISHMANMMVQNSTISGNSAGGRGGGIGVWGDDFPVLLSVQNSTIAFNQAVFGGGGIYSRQPVRLQSTIVAQNKSANQVGRDLHSETKLATFTIEACLIGDPSGAYLNPIGFNLVGVDPLLAPLAWNGGPTQTHALLPGSPAIDNGSNPAGLVYDQRGSPFKRVKGGFADIGAFEL